MTTLTNIREIQLAAEILEAEQGKAEFLANLDAEHGCHLAKTMKEIFEIIRPAIHNYFLSQEKIRRKSVIYVLFIKPSLEKTSMLDAANTVSYLLARLLVSKYSEPHFLTTIGDALLESLRASFNNYSEETLGSSPLASCIGLIRFVMNDIPFISLLKENKPKGNNYLAFDEAKINEIEERIERIADNAVKFMPMRCKPNQIKNLTSHKAGFLHHRSPFLKRPAKIGGKLHPLLANFNDKTAPEFFEAINQHQNVSYQINKPVLNILLSLRDKGVNLDPLWTNVDAALESAKDDCEVEIADLNKARVEKYKEDARPVPDSLIKVISRNHATKARQAVNKCTKLLETAIELATWDEFFFPIFADDRARLYYYSNKINPQGSQLDKALLQFTGSVELNEDNIEDLYIVLGNALGYGKKTIEFRIQKAIEFIPTIMTGDWELVMSQLDEDEVFTGLAICLDVKGYEDAKANGTTYQSHLPLHFDSCNSGSQINGLLLKDKRNCTLSNIINTESDTLFDTYQAVADILKANLEANESGFFDNVLKSPEIFNRTVFKKSSMVRSNYGAKAQTCYDDITMMMKARHKAVWDSWTPNEKKLFLEESVRAVDESLPASNNFKLFADVMIRKIAKEQGSFAYNQPLTGFPVIIRKVKEKTETISYREPHAKGSKSFNYTSKTDDVSFTKTASSGVPSVVHSFDGAVVLEIRKELGDAPMVSIHDSIGVLAGTRKPLIKAVNKVYHKIAVNNYLQDIADQVGYPAKVPLINTLDTDLVLEAKHAFS